jgi:hypothetical protein
MREGLGVWDEMSGPTVVDMHSWGMMTDEASAIEGPVVFAVDAAPDRSTAVIAVAGFRPDGMPHIELVRYGRSMGWVLPELVRLSQGHVVLDGKSAAKSLIPGLEDAGITPLVTSADDMAVACGWFVDGVADRSFRHLGDLELEKAIRSAGIRKLGDAFGFDRRKGDIAPLMAAVLALYGLRMVPQTQEVAPWVVYA